MTTKLIKGLAVTFGLVSLGGCATMNYTGTDDCVERNGFSMNIPVLVSVSKRNDKFSEECATAKAATAISGMKRRDGSPDMSMYNLAVSMYEQSNQKVRDFMDKMLKEEQGTSITAMKFELDKTREPVSCERVTVADASGAPTTGFRCTGKTAPVAQTAAPAAR